VLIFVTGAVCTDSAEIGYFASITAQACIILQLVLSRLQRLSEAVAMHQEMVALQPSDQLRIFAAQVKCF